MTTKIPFNPQYPISPDLFYGREEVIRRFNQDISQSKSGTLTNMAIIGKFGIGKTSLLNKLYSIETDKNIAKIKITLKDTYTNSLEDLIGFIYTSLGKTIKKFLKSIDLTLELPYLKLDESNKISKDIFRENLIKLWGDIKQNTNLVVIFIDDFHLANKYFMDIRNCFQELADHGCKYILVTTMILESLKFGKREDPFKRFFDFNKLEEFSERDTINMIKSVVKKSNLDVSFNSEVLKMIYSETLGHPYYISLIVNEILRHKSSGRITQNNFKKIHHKINKQITMTFDGYYSDLSWKEESTIKKIVDLDIDVFSPSSVSSATDTMYSLESKDVLKKVKYGKYSFKHPIIKSYFVGKYSEEKDLGEKVICKICGVNETDNPGGICDDCKFSVISNNDVPPNI